MLDFKVALLQILPQKSIKENLQKGLAYCKKAKEMGADIAVFPEMWSVGYYIPEDIEILKNLAISDDSKFINEFSELAKKLNMAIAITFLEKYEPLPRNTVCIFNRFGEISLKYSKVHTCDFGDEARLTAGDDFYTCELNTKNGNIKIGAMICYDREFPESARILMLKGAEIILVPNACNLEINRISQLRARAYENMLGIATVNYPIGHTCCNGHSLAYDGIAYEEDGNSRDILVIEAGEREGIYISDFDIDKIRKYREEEVHGNTYRKPKKYQILTSEKIEAPFIRNDYRK